MQNEPLLRKISRRLVPEWLREDSESFLLPLAVLVGLVMGAISAGFRFLIVESHHLFFTAAQFSESRGPVAGSPIAMGLIRLMLPALGGFVVGAIVYRLMNLEGGHGVSGIMKALAIGRVDLDPKMMAKSSTAIITVASGGSTGPEGPTIEIGSVMGSLIGQTMHLARDRMGTLVGCGAAAGIAGVFNAPIGGVFLALELLLRDFTIKSFGPIVVAAVVASVTSSTILPNTPAFTRVPPEVFATIVIGWKQLIMFGVLGALLGAVGSAFIAALYRAHDLFHHVGIPRWLKPALGGLMVGAVGLMFPTVIGEGYEYVNERILDPEVGIQMKWGIALSLLAVAFVKIAVSCMTLGSGGTGGVFAPAMVIGAMVGAGIGTVCHLLFGDAAPGIPIFALAGMAGCIASVMHVPIAAILLIYEISGTEYRLVVPTMICVTASSLVAARIGLGSVYTIPLLRDGFDLAREAWRASDPLASIRIDSLMRGDFTRLAAADELGHMLDTFASTQEDAFVVVDGTNQLKGLISAADLRGALSLAAAGAAIIAADAADPSPPVLYPDMSAGDARSIFAESHWAALPVVASAGDRTVVGMVSHADIIRAYREGDEEEKD